MFTKFDDSIYKKGVNDLSKFSHKDKIYNSMIQFIEKEPIFSAIVDFFMSENSADWTKKEWNHQIWRRIWMSSKLFHVSLEGRNYKLTKWGIRHANLESKLSLSDFSPNSYIKSKKYDKGLKKEKKKDLKRQAKRDISVNSSNNDENLFDNLRVLRNEIAKKSSIPSYLIFTNQTLTELTNRRPTNLKDLANISGIGEVKGEKYGQEFLDKIKSYDGTLSQSDEEEINSVITEIPVEISSNNEMLEEVIPLMQSNTKSVNENQSKEYETVAIIDASNVVYSQQPWKLSTLTDVRDQLLKKYDKVDIICDANLRHQFTAGSQDREDFEKSLSSGNIQQSPAGREADFFILKWVNNYIRRNKKPCIISNDLFRDYYDDFPWLKTREYQKNFMLQNFGDQVELVLT